MSDTPDRQAQYKPEEGAEVRAAPRYSVAPVAPVAPVGLGTLTRDVSGTPYQSPSILAVVAFVLAVGYCFLIALGGIAAFWNSSSGKWVLIIGTVLVPLLSVPVATLFNIRGIPARVRFASLALAGFYAVPIGIIGLIAFPHQSPWLIPLWTLAFPCAAVAIGAAAQVRIQTSEGTLIGKPLAKWAIGLSLFFALCYAAFYTATYVAVRKQAIEFADDWLDSVEKEKLERAFILTQDPQERTNETPTREVAESLNARQVNSEGRGSYALFSEKPVVRLLKGSTKANIELLGVRDWGYENSGYVVELSYRVTTECWTFTLELMVYGVESTKGEYKGRHWSVRPDSPALGLINPQRTPKGEAVLALALSGQEFADQWVRVLSTHPFSALDDTVLGREGNKEGIPGATIAPGALGVGLRAYQVTGPFFQGELVKSSDKDFWAKAQYRGKLVDRAKKLFSPGDEKPANFGFRDLRNTMPSWGESDGRLFYSYDADMIIPVALAASQGTQPRIVHGLIECRLVLSCPSEALTTGKPEWRVEALELVRGRPMEDPKGGNPRGQTVPPGGMQPQGR